MKFAQGELDQYLDIEWINNKNDWYKKEFTHKAYHTKICEASDFGDDDKAKELLVSWILKITFMYLLEKVRPRSKCWITPAA